MRRVLTSLVLLFAALAAGCATAPAPRREVPEQLFADRLFDAPTERVGADAIFSMNDDMRRYLQTQMAPLVRSYGSQRALIEALYHRRELMLEYESSRTRNAAEAFEARAGNCLSLAIMTAAFAKEMGLPVRYQSAYREETWVRKGDLLVRSGHVNVTLGKALDNRLDPFSSSLTIDFLPQDDVRNLRTVEIPESLVIAMFMNNRAVEALVRDRIDDAYAWTRASIRAEPDFLAALNTLGVVYLRRGALSEAAAAFDYVLAQDAGQTRSLANLIEVRTRQGRSEEVEQLRARLAQLEPDPPLHYYNLGLEAMQRQDYESARELFDREIARGYSDASIHYWLGVANYRLGDVERASSELKLAAEASVNSGERHLYSAKLEWLRAHRAH